MKDTKGSFDGKFLKVTPSVIEGVRHIKVLRPLTEDDFDFTVKPQEYVSPTMGINVGIEVNGVLNQGLLDEILAVFTEGNYDNWQLRDSCFKLRSGNYNGADSVTDDFRGCRSESSRKAKVERVRPILRAKADALVAKVKAVIVTRLNDMIKSIADAGNRSYEQSVYQLMISDAAAWIGLEDRAGVKEKKAQIAAARETIKKLSAEVKAALNKAMLDDMEESGWTVNEVPLTPEMIERLKETYGQGEAFSSSSSHHIFMD